MTSAGVIERIRPAASSIASGRPSSRWHNSTTAERVAGSTVPSVPTGPTVNAGATRLARSRNSSTASGAVPPGASRTAMGSSSNTDSSGMFSGTCDVASTVTPAQFTRIAWAILGATWSTRCSRLSITSRARRACRKSIRRSVGERLLAGVTASAVVTASTTGAPTGTGASSINHTPSANCSEVRAVDARTRARWVLPTPPGPVTVTSRCSASIPVSAARAAARPMRPGGTAGRLPGRCRSAPGASGPVGRVGVGALVVGAVVVGAVVAGAVSGSARSSTRS